MDDKNRVNVVLPENYNGAPVEVIIREGSAKKELDPKYPEVINIKGVIDTPVKWIRQRATLFNHTSSHILVERESITIQLIVNETDYFKSTITGELNMATKVLEFGINTGKVWEPEKLGQFIKMNRALFTDKTKNMELVSLLKNFKAKVSHDIEKYKEENGSRADNFVQIVDSNIPSGFKIYLPVFKGFQPEEIEVEIYSDVNGRDISLTLVSPGLEELIEEYRDKVIDDQLKEIEMLAPGIVVIEQ